MRCAAALIVLPYFLCNSSICLAANESAQHLKDSEAGATSTTGAQWSWPTWTTEAETTVADSNKTDTPSNLSLNGILKIARLPFDYKEPDKTHESENSKSYETSRYFNFHDCVSKCQIGIKKVSSKDGVGFDQATYSNFFSCVKKCKVSHLDIPAPGCLDSNGVVVTPSIFHPTQTDYRIYNIVQFITTHKKMITFVVFLNCCTLLAVLLLRKMELVKYYFLMAISPLTNLQITALSWNSSREIRNTAERIFLRAADTFNFIIRTIKLNFRSEDLGNSLMIMAGRLSTRILSLSWLPDHIAVHFPWSDAAAAMQQESMYNGYTPYRYYEVDDIDDNDVHQDSETRSSATHKFQNEGSFERARIGHFNSNEKRTFDRRCINERNNLFVDIENESTSEMWKDTDDELEVLQDPNQHHVYRFRPIQTSLPNTSDEES